MLICEVEGMQNVRLHFKNQQSTFDNHQSIARRDEATSAGVTHGGKGNGIQKEGRSLPSVAGLFEAGA
ncbi:MAG: hypothetical protein GTO03_10035 [Planctomycetales bacterium]|nr:hypothetical protein [Planctomycetales bacterium]